jgi:hypothetical protein
VVQQYRHVVALVDVFAHPFKATPQAAGNLTRKGSNELRVLFARRKIRMSQNIARGCERFKKNVRLMPDIYHFITYPPLLHVSHFHSLTALAAPDEIKRKT